MTNAENGEIKKPSSIESGFVLIRIKDLLKKLAQSDVDESDLGPVKNKEENSTQKTEEPPTPPPADAS